MVRNLAFFICTLLTFGLLAQRVVTLSDSIREFVFQGDYLEILEDKERRWTIEDVSQSPLKDSFLLNKSSYPYNHNIQSAYWIRFQIVNKAQKSRNFLLESYAPHTNSWELYLPSQSGFRMKRSGIDLYFYDREYVNKNLILDLPFEKDTNVFYVRVLSSNHSSFDYRIKSVSHFFSYSVNEYYFLGMYYGIMVIMAVYNLLIFLFLRERVYIYYVFYVFAGILTTLCDDGIGYQFIWTNASGLNAIIGAQIAPALLLISFILYSRSFLRLKFLHPSYDKFVVLVTGLYFAYYLLKLTVIPLKFHFHGFYLVPFMVVYAMAIRIYLKGYKPSRFMIVGFGFILISILIIKLRSNGSIEGNLFTVYSFNYGLVLEVLILTIAMGERFRFAKKNEALALLELNKAQQEVIQQMKINESLQQKVTKELEFKVEERTHELHVKNAELEIANQKLKEMTDKANQMSLKLDLDNWNLHKKVINSIRDRMLGQEVSYQEFTELFPDDAACHRYLKELKWSDGFECKKCRNKECTEVENSFSVRCLRCGYVESITAHTLFHATKFPLKNAFYILYLVIFQSNRHTLQEISDLTHVGKLSVWKFKQKIIHHSELLKKTKKKRSLDSHQLWESIILEFRKGS